MPSPSRTSARPSAKELVGITRKCLRGASSNTHDRLWSRTPHLDLRTTPGGLTRGLEIYQALIRALGPAGVSVSLKGDETMLGIDGEELPIALRERTVRTKHVPTEKELHDARLGIGLVYSTQWDFVPTREFYVIVDAIKGWNGVKQWLVKPEEPLEAIVTNIVGMLPGLAVAKRARREEQERLMRQYEAEQQARYEEQKHQAAERARLDALLEEVTRWQQASAVRAYCGTLVAQGVPAADSDLESWLADSLRLAEKLDPLPARLGPPRTTGGPPVVGS